MSPHEDRVVRSRGRAPTVQYPFVLTSPPQPLPPLYLNLPLFLPTLSYHARFTIPSFTSHSFNSISFRCSPHSFTPLCKVPHCHLSKPIKFLSVDKKPIPFTRKLEVSGRHQQPCLSLTLPTYVSSSLSRLLPSPPRSRPPALTTWVTSPAPTQSSFVMSAPTVTSAVGAQTAMATPSAARINSTSLPASQWLPTPCPTPPPTP